MRKGSFNHDPVAQIRARSMRAEMSVGEQIVWSMIRKDQLGFRFRSQFRVGPYILDFYCAKAKLCIEVDGEQHLGRAGYDAARDEFLKKAGIETMRIPSLDLVDPDPMKRDRWVRAIELRCRERAGISYPQRRPSLTTTLRDGTSESAHAKQIHPESPTPNPLPHLQPK